MSPACRTRLAMSWMSGHPRSSQLRFPKKRGAKCSQASCRLRIEFALVKAGVALGEGWSDVTRQEINLPEIGDQAQVACPVEDAGKIAERYKSRALLTGNFR